MKPLKPLAKGTFSLFQEIYRERLKQYNDSLLVFLLIIRITKSSAR